MSAAWFIAIPIVAGSIVIQLILEARRKARQRTSYADTTMADPDMWHASDSTPGQQYASHVIDRCVDGAASDAGDSGSCGGDDGGAGGDGGGDGGGGGD